MIPLLKNESGFSFKDKRIALLYDDIVRPDTTGVYCRKALEKICRVEHFQPTEMEKVPAGFDLYLFIDDGFRYFLPDNLSPSAWWVIDTHLNYDENLRSAGQFDYLFTAQRDAAIKFKQDGMKNAQWLPLACDPERHKKVATDKKFDVVFVGNFVGKEREGCLKAIRKYFPNHFIGQKYFDEMAETFSEGRTVFNQSISNDINMRVFEALSTGSLLITNAIDDNGLDALFEDRKHLVMYKDEADLIARINEYLELEEEREAIADAGRNHVHKYHTYQHRMGAVLQSAFANEYTGLNSGSELTAGLCSIVILTHNQLEYTKLCVKSVERFMDSDYEIIFVDNASTDGTVEYLTSIVEQNDNYSLIANRENLGYAAGNNRGINGAKGEFTLIMNNDVLLTDGSVESLIQVLNEDDNCALVGPRTNFVKGRQIDLEAKYSSVSEMVEYAESNSKNNKGKSSIEELLVGFCFMGRTKLLKSVGGFDEDYGIGNYEDNDLCKTLTSKGYVLKIGLDSYVHHFGHVSFDASDIDYNSLVEENRIKFENKWNKTDEESNPAIDNSWIAEEVTEKMFEHGKWCAENGFWEMALKSFSSLIELSGSSENYVNYGVALWESGKQQEAFQAFKRALEIDSGNGDAVVNLIDSGYNLGLHSEVESSLKQAIKDDEQTELWYLLADCQFRQGEYQKSEATIRSLLKEDPDNEELKSLLTEVETKMEINLQEEVAVQ